MSVALDSTIAMVRGDLRALPFGSSAFDTIVYLNVFEDVGNDDRAFAEIRRLLKPEGFGLLMATIGGKRGRQDEALGTDARGWRRDPGGHGQPHGMGFPQRARAAGLSVDVLAVDDSFTPEETRRHALTSRDRVFFRVSRA